MSSVHADWGCNPTGTIVRISPSSMQARTFAQIGDSIRTRAEMAIGEPMQVCADAVLSCPCSCSPELPLASTPLFKLFCLSTTSPHGVLSEIREHEIP